MVSKSTAWASLLALFGTAPIVQALTLDVATGGGNASSPILYGLLFEVGKQDSLR